MFEGLDMAGQQDAASGGDLFAGLNMNAPEPEANTLDTTGGSYREPSSQQAAAAHVSQYVRSALCLLSLSMTLGKPACMQAAFVPSAELLQRPQAQHCFRQHVEMPGLRPAFALHCTSHLLEASQKV